MRWKKIILFFIYCAGACASGAVGLGETSWSRTIYDENENVEDNLTFKSKRWS